jgi:hypothetical protein
MAEFGNYTDVVADVKQRLTAFPRQQVFDDLVKLGASSIDATALILDASRVSSRTWDFIFGEIKRLVEYHEMQPMPYRSPDETRQDATLIAQGWLIEYSKESPMRIGTWIKASGFDNPRVVLKVGQVITDLIRVHSAEKCIAERMAGDEVADAPVPSSERVSVQWYGRQPGADGLSEVCVGFHDPKKLVEITDEELESQIGIEAARRERELRYKLSREAGTP